MNANWQDEVELSGDFGLYRYDLIMRLSKFGTMCAGLSERIKAHQHRTEISSADVPLTFLLSYRAGPKARWFRKNEVAKMLELEVFKLAQTKLASPFF